MRCQNSSSGLLEVPGFEHTVNIGSRQEGRLKSLSVIDCPPESNSIYESIALAFSSEFQSQSSCSANPYGDGGAVESILSTLESFSLENLLQKQFFDIVNS